MKVGCAVSITMPAGLLSVTSVAHGGTMTGPITPDVAVSPLRAVASTRQNTLPILKAWLGTKVSAVVVLSMSGLAKVVSRATVRVYRTGCAKAGTFNAAHANRGVVVTTIVSAGSTRVTPRGKVAARVTSGVPQPWFESGPEPVFAAADKDEPSAFVRVLVLPGEWEGKRTIRYVDPADEDKPMLQRATVFFERPIRS